MGVCAVAVPPLGSVVVAPGIPWGNAQLDSQQLVCPTRVGALVARRRLARSKCERPEANRSFARGQSSPARTLYPHGQTAAALEQSAVELSRTRALCTPESTTNDGFPGAPMEDLARLVADSLARHGYDAPVDHRRLEWSRWFRCDSTSFLLVPSSPGIYALGEEIGTPGSASSVLLSEVRRQPNESKDPVSAGATKDLNRGSHGDSGHIIGSRRMLAVFEIADTDDLGAALSRLFAPGHPLRDRLASGRCFARYSRVADPGQRSAASSALQQWLASSMELSTGFQSVDGAAGVPARPSREATPKESPATKCGEKPEPHASLVETAPALIPQIPVTRPQPEPSPQAPIATTSKVALRRSPPPLPAGF